MHKLQELDGPARRAAEGEAEEDGAGGVPYTCPINPATIRSRPSTSGIQ